MNSKNIAIDFFNSWMTTGIVDGKFFSEDFTFIGPSPVVDADAWLMNSDEELPIEDVKIIETIVTDATTVLLYECLDPVTLLTYRTAWFFIIEREKICRLTEVRQNIHPRQPIR